MRCIVCNCEVIYSKMFLDFVNFPPSLSRNFATPNFLFIKDGWSNKCIKEKFFFFFKWKQNVLFYNCSQDLSIAFRSGCWEE
jgi:hypothetical protein